MAPAALLLALLLPAVPQIPVDQDLAELYGDRFTPEARVYRSAGPSVVSVDVFANRLDRRGALSLRPVTRAQVGQGTGVVIHESGLVITNAHVALPEDPWLDRSSVSFEVAFAEEFGGERYPARLLSVDEEADLALLGIEAERRFKAIPLGRSDDLLKGEKVIAIGSPFRNSHSITSGILSGMHRDVEVQDRRGRRRHLEGLLQTDAAINPGNSGGPLLNIYGELVGINNATMQLADGIGFAIPVDRVRRILDERLLEADGASRFWIGMRVRTDGENRPVAALVHPRGPAARAGLQDGDRLLAVNGQPVTSREELAAELLPHAPGDRVRFRILRPADGREREAVVVLEAGERRDNYGLLGFEARRAAIVVRRGGWPERLPILRITRVYPDTSAAALGLREGDYLVGVRLKDRPEGQEWTLVSSVSQLVALVRGPDFDLEHPNLWVLRGDETYHGQLVPDDPDLQP